ncbi:MAG TPA: altronate dehydratase family protein [Oscillospiraceae bacterium]|nr:altronate dehydratase family protein [Oscillospiraceae bacterium]
MHKAILINKSDSVAVALQELKKGDMALNTKLLSNVPFGHKFAVHDIKKGSSVIKYGFVIGEATDDIKAGSHVDTHNLKTKLEYVAEYEYNKENPERTEKPKERHFFGYERQNKTVGIRNEIFIVPTVGCVNNTAEIIAKKANERFPDLCDGFFAFPHPYGCSQLGKDGENTASFLAAVCRHPNAGGVLLLGLGCENNNISVMEKHLSGADKSRIRFLITQNESDEVETALTKIQELCENAVKDKRTKQPLSKLVVGMKCGGSDAFSGITANPLCGFVSDYITALGGSVILTEVPEMFGAETQLFNRCENEDVFKGAVSLINNFKCYFLEHGEPIYENPSPGNREGGITTLEEKSLGCIQKGGKSIVTDVLPLYGRCKKGGLSLLYGPGNDIVSSANLAASGANIILFTTGRGTPLGTFVPTIKISSNTILAKRKPNWIDFDAGKVLKDTDFLSSRDELINLIIEIANGEKRTQNEKNGYRDIAIFKSGVTL